MRLVLRYQQGGTAAGGLVHAPRDGREDMIGRSVIDVLRGIEAQTIQVIFINPVAGIGNDELTDRPRIRAVVIDWLAPVGLVAVGEVVGAEVA